MAYCTEDDLIERFGESEVIQLTDADDTGIVGTRSAQAIADADARIDAKLRGRYALPIDPAPTELKLIACDIARFFLYDDAVPDAVKARFDFAVKELDAYATGKAVLDAPLAQAGETPSGPQRAAVVAPTSVFDDATIGLMP